MSLRLSDSWSAEFPAKVKRHNYSKGIGVCGGCVVGNASSSHKDRAVWWPGNDAEFLELEGKKDLSALGARGMEIVGRWSASNGNKVGAVLWQIGAGGALIGIDLHPAGYERSYAQATSRGVQVGAAYPKPKKGEYGRSRAMLWTGASGSRELSATEWAESWAFGTDGEQHVGYVEGGSARLAALWRGEGTSLEILGKPGTISEARAVRDGEQVGAVLKGAKNRAALWKGTPDSLIDLTPEGFESSGANDCAGGFQVGYIQKHDLTPSGSSNMETRAALWYGSSKHIDLQAFLPEEWNASTATYIEVNGSDITVVGTAQKISTTGAGVTASQALVESAVAIWRGRAG